MHTVLEQSSNVAGLAGKGERKVAKEDNIRGDSRKSTVMRSDTRESLGCTGARVHGNQD